MRIGSVELAVLLKEVRVALRVDPDSLADSIGQLKDVLLDLNRVKWRY